MRVVLDLLILVAMLGLAGAFIYSERRQAARSGRKPRTAVLVLCIIAGFLGVVGAALLVVDQATR